MAIACALGLTACKGGSVFHKPVSRVVSVKNFAFIPDTLTVSAGDTVVWRIDDPVPHTVRSDSNAVAPAFDSDHIREHTSWRWVAKGEGRHPYHCAYHPNMTGVVTVK